MLNNPDVIQIIRIAEILADRGWAEANAGNLSIHAAPGSVKKLPPLFDEMELKDPFPALDGEFFLVTATKSRARDAARLPEETIGLVELFNNGKSIRCHWGRIPPTSEFPAHLSVYDTCGENRTDIRAILHTHPPNIIAMSHLPEMLEPGKLNTTLRMMHPELGILLPDGVSTLEYRIPGSIELGAATSEALRNCNVAVWPMHGVVSIAGDMDKALDQVEMVEKAAMIYLLARSTGQEPVGLTDEQVRSSREHWGVTGDLP
jgi:rhamnulose-1-phosphate aldolase